MDLSLLKGDSGTLHKKSKILLNFSLVLTFLVVISFASCWTDPSHLDECVGDKLDQEFFEITKDLAEYLIKNKVILEYSLSEMHGFLIKNDPLEIEEYRIFNKYEKQLPNLGQLYSIMGCCSYLIESELKIPRNFQLLCDKYPKFYDGRIDFVDFVDMIKNKYESDPRIKATMLIQFYYIVYSEGYKKFGDLRDLFQPHNG